MFETPPRLISAAFRVCGRFGALGYTHSARGCSSMVERQLPKLKVAGSSPVSRSSASLATAHEAVALRWGLNVSHPRRSIEHVFDSAPYPPLAEKAGWFRMHARKTGPGLGRLRRARRGTASAVRARDARRCRGRAGCAMARAGRPSARARGGRLPSPARVMLGFGAVYSAGEGDSSRHRGVDLEAAAGARVRRAAGGPGDASSGSVPGVGGGRVTAVTIETARGKITLLPLERASRVARRRGRRGRRRSGRSRRAVTARARARTCTSARARATCTSTRSA